MESPKMTRTVEKLSPPGGKMRLSPGERLKILRGRRLNAVRLSYLIPGQTTRGPFNLNIKGVGWNDSQVSQYKAADQAFHDAGCA